MIKLIAGLKGTGKTKTLIDMVNTKVEATEGSVVCVEKGNQLIHEIKHEARLINTDELNVSGAVALYGLVAGIIASNHDITDIFIDSALKICGNDVDGFKAFMLNAAGLAEAHDINLVATASIKAEDLPEELKKFF